MIRRILYKFFGQQAYIQFEAWKQRREFKRYQYRDQESAFLDHFVKEGDICLDIGANLGTYAYYLSNIVSDSGVIFAFEPVNETYKGLISNLEKMNLTNVKAYNLGVSNRDKIADLFVPKIAGLPSHGRAHLYAPMDQESGDFIETQLVTIDAFHDEHRMTQIDFIKMDIEGAELLAIEGSERVINKYKPNFLLEIEEQHTGKYSYKPQDIFKKLSSFGYKQVLCVNENKLLKLDIESLMFTSKFDDTLEKMVGYHVNNFYVTC